ncbi:hypothetical protein Tco_1292146 [Tanacetum coccineum]
MLFYSWDGGIDVYADLTRSSPLTHTVVVYFVSVTLLKRIRKFFMNHDIGARDSVHIFSWINFVIAKGVEAKMVSRLPTNHVVSCAEIIGIKHRHNVVRDTLVDICYRSGISAGKEVDIGLDGGRDKPLRPADMLLYSWDGGLDVCVDLTGSSPLTQTGMVDFVPELEADAVTLFKRIRKFFMAHDIGARAAVHIFNRISFAIAKGVGAQIVYRLPSNFL